MNTGCIIEARMRSTRLPGKVLKPILGRPMLALMIERLRRAKTIDGIIVATTDNPADEPIAELAKAEGVGVFRGSEEDVLARVVGAANAHDVRIIVETTGDCPLIDPSLLDKVVSDYLIGGADFVSNVLPHTTPRGTDVRVFSTTALQHIADTSNDPADREHVSLHFWEHPEKYRLRNVVTQFPEEVAELRLTVDTPEDFELVRRTYEALYPTNPSFSLGDILDFLEKNPDVAMLNRTIQQKAVRTTA